MRRIDLGLVVIGLSGRIGSGKDSAANALELLGYHRLALADAMKSALDDAGGPSRAAHKLLDELGMSNRQGWQQLGTEARKLVAADGEGAGLWCDVLLAKVAFLARVLGDRLPEGRRIARFVVPDVRYPHEPVRLRTGVGRLGGVYETWRITRPSLPDPAPGEHPSELFADAIPAQAAAVNDGTLLDLARKVIAVADERFPR